MCAYQVVEHIQCKTAREFIEAISPIGQHFKSTNDVWIFRGHGDDNYKLVPSALREEKFNELHELAHTKSSITHSKIPSNDISEEDIDRFLKNPKGQCLAEALILGNFYNYADRYGLELPEDSQELCDYLKYSVKYMHPNTTFIKCGGDNNPTIDWPIDAFMALTALAQHHGLFTRLLDWSLNPYTAAYFAAIDAITPKEKNISSECMAIWALITPQWPNEGLIFTFDNGISLRLIAVPRAANKNLHAQEGVFTLISGMPKDKEFAIIKRPLDISISEKISQIESSLNGPFLYHFTLPSSEAGKVLWYLDKIGVNAAKLFPGFDGAARAVQEQMHQQEPENP